MSALPANYDLYHRRGVQKALNEKVPVSPALTVDGAFGAISIQALEAFQQKSGIPQTGVYDSTTQALLEPFIAQKYVSMAIFQASAAGLGVKLAAIQANSEVESGGAGFFPSGQCAIRFERHQMYNMLVQQKGKATADGLSKRYPSVVNPTPGGYATDPYTQYSLALTIDQSCAMMATSFGMFQIMGFNFAACGYSTVQGYVADALLSEGKQFSQYVNFIKSYRNGVLLTALRNLDWVTFAQVYNGTGAVASYSGKMSSFYTSFTANPNG